MHVVELGQEDLQAHVERCTYGGSQTGGSFTPFYAYEQDLLRGSENQPWSDVQALDWGKVNQEDQKANGGDLKSPAEHCEYQYLAHVEGWAYSGRLK